MDTNGVHRSRRGGTFLSFCPSLLGGAKASPGVSESLGSARATGSEPKPTPEMPLVFHGFREGGFACTVCPSLEESKLLSWGSAPAAGPLCNIWDWSSRDISLAVGMPFAGSVVVMGPSLK